MGEPRRAKIEAARERENATFAEVLDSQANLEALTAFAEGAGAGLQRAVTEAGSVVRPTGRSRAVGSSPSDSADDDQVVTDLRAGSPRAG